MNTTVKHQAGSGRIEAEMRDIVLDMTMMALGALAVREIFVSEEERTALQQTINEHVNGSIEIRNAVIAMVERGA